MRSFCRGARFQEGFRIDLAGFRYLSAGRIHGRRCFLCARPAGRVWPQGRGEGAFATSSPQRPVIPTTSRRGCLGDGTLCVVNDDDFDKRPGGSGRAYRSQTDSRISDRYRRDLFVAPALRDDVSEHGFCSFVLLGSWPVTVRDGRSGPMSFPQEFSAETSFLWGLQAEEEMCRPAIVSGKIKYILLLAAFFYLCTFCYCFKWPVGAGVAGGCES